jgi:amino acid transporter
MSNPSTHQPRRREVARREPARRETAREDETHLLRLGYSQVLSRKMSGYSNFAISFTIISVFTGYLPSYYIGFNNGGPAIIMWGSLIVGPLSILVAMAMAEIASSMPTAGALYFWASRLGGPAWGWFTGWFNLVGLIAVTAAVQYASATFATALLNLWFPDLVGTDNVTIFVVMTVIAAVQLGVNFLDVNNLSLLNVLSGWWHMVGVGLVVVVLLVVPRQHQSVGFVFGQVLNNSGFSDSSIWYVFGIGLLLPVYSLVGYDASAHMSEETRSASRSSALGMVWAVGASVVLGFVLLMSVTFAVPDVQGTLDAGGMSVIYIWSEATNDAWAEFLLIITVVAQLFCGMASVTSGSRMMFAFSRDGAVPGSRLWRRVNARRVPVNAVIAIVVISWALMLPTLVNGVVGYAVGTSIAVIGLSIAFALPIILRIRAGARFEPGAWSLGRHYRWVSRIAVAWIVFICVLFLLPISPNGIPGAEGFSFESVNYAPLTVGGAVLLFGGWYIVSARRWFTGPVREDAADAALAAVLDGPSVPMPPGGAPGDQFGLARRRVDGVHPADAGRRQQQPMRPF